MTADQKQVMFERLVAMLTDINVVYIKHNMAVQFKEGDIESTAQRMIDSGEAKAYWPDL